MTHDAAAVKFVEQHNRICARYYEWLTHLRRQFGDSPAPKRFLDHTKVRGLLHLGNLDSCGAMGNAMRESMMYDPDRVTTNEKAVILRIGDWVVHKQDRLPDGTLWRSSISVETQTSQRRI